MEPDEDYDDDNDVDDIIDVLNEQIIPVIICFVW